MSKSNFEGACATQKSNQSAMSDAEKSQSGFDSERANGKFIFVSSKDDGVKELGEAENHGETPAFGEADFAEPKSNFASVPKSEALPKNSGKSNKNQSPDSATDSKIRATDRAGKPHKRDNVNSDSRATFSDNGEHDLSNGNSDSVGAADFGEESSGFDPSGEFSFADENSDSTAGGEFDFTGANSDFATNGEPDFCEEKSQHGDSTESEAQPVLEDSEDSYGKTSSGAYATSSPEVNGGTGDKARAASTFENDLRVLISEFPELRSAVRGGISIKRYGELRSLGLTVREAYLAASAPGGRDNRAHMISGVPTGARSPELGMNSRQMEIARGLFHDLSEQEIKRLYAAVTK